VELGGVPRPAVAEDLVTVPTCSAEPAQKVVT
jgi:hypothetical protein